jgi:uncharacterized protein
MLSLPELQADFAAALTDARQLPAALPRFSGPPARTAQRLAIYRGNVYGNLAKALAGAYPVTRKVVGEEFFDAMAREYAREHPSRSGDLNRYGERLAEFVAAFPHTADLPYLPDVARMEWLAHLAYYAADPAPFDVAALSRVSAQEYSTLKFRLAPACVLLESRWPLARIWTVHQDDYGHELDVDLQSGPDRVLVHRPRWQAEVQSVAAGDFRFLDSLSQGETLGTALEVGTREPGFDSSAALARWIVLGVVAGLV